MEKMASHSDGMFDYSRLQQKSARQDTDLSTYLSYSHSEPPAKRKRKSGASSKLGKSAGCSSATQGINDISVITSTDVKQHGSRKKSVASRKKQKPQPQKQKQVSIAAKNDPSVFQVKKQRQVKSKTVISISDMAGTSGQGSQRGAKRPATKIVVYPKKQKNEAHKKQQVLARKSPVQNVNSSVRADNLFLLSNVADAVRSLAEEEKKCVEKTRQLLQSGGGDHPRTARRPKIRNYSLEEHNYSQRSHSDVDWLAGEQSESGSDVGEGVSIQTGKGAKGVDVKPKVIVLPRKKVKSLSTLSSSLVTSDIRKGLMGQAAKDGLRERLRLALRKPFSSQKPVASISDSTSDEALYKVTLVSVSSGEQGTPSQVVHSSIGQTRNLKSITDLLTGSQPLLQEERPPAFEMEKRVKIDTSPVFDSPSRISGGTVTMSDMTSAASYFATDNTMQHQHSLESRISRPVALAGMDSEETIVNRAATSRTSLEELYSIAVGFSGDSDGIPPLPPLSSQCFTSQTDQTDCYQPAETVCKPEVLPYVSVNNLGVTDSALSLQCITNSADQTHYCQTADTSSECFTNNADQKDCIQTAVGSDGMSSGTDGHEEATRISVFLAAPASVSPSSVSALSSDWAASATNGSVQTETGPEPDLSSTVMVSTVDSSRDVSCQDSVRDAAIYSQENLTHDNGAHLSGVSMEPETHSLEQNRENTSIDRLAVSKDNQSDGPDNQHVSNMSSEVISKAVDSRSLDGLFENSVRSSHNEIVDEVSVASILAGQPVLSLPEDLFQDEGEAGSAVSETVQDSIVLDTIQEQMGGSVSDGMISHSSDDDDVVIVADSSEDSLGKVSQSSSEEDPVLGQNFGSEDDSVCRIVLWESADDDSSSSSIGRPDYGISIESLTSEQAAAEGSGLYGLNEASMMLGALPDESQILYARRLSSSSDSTMLPAVVNDSESGEAQSKLIKGRGKKIYNLADKILKPQSSRNRLAQSTHESSV